MIESWFHSLAQWPPLVVYGLIAVSCAIENIFPPSPSDVFVAIAAFLSHDGRYAPVAIFLTAWVGSLAGAVSVYTGAARFADRFTASRVGRLIVPPSAMAFLLRQYGRYGALGLFLTRLLPGFRSVVAPFAGLNRIGPVRFLLPTTLASGLWFAALTWIGAELGDQWDVIVGVLDTLYSTLGVASGILILVLVVGFFWWRRRTPAV